MIQKDKIHYVTAASILIAIIVMGVKYWAYAITGSVALYSDALESIVNVIAAFMAFWAVRIAATPPDADHPFGHHKAEYFSAVLEGVLIVVAALLILHEAYEAWLSPRFLLGGKSDGLVSGLIVNGAAAIINCLWCLVLLRYGRLWRSPAMSADGSHLLADVISSVGVIGGLLIAWATGILWLDPLIAVCVAMNVLWQGWLVVRHSVDGLMDKALPPNVEKKVRKVISDNATGALEVHDLKTRIAGRAVFIEFHMVVDGQMSVADSHSICDHVEEALRDSIDGAVVSIHVEPEEKAKGHGVRVI